MKNPTTSVCIDEAAYRKSGELSSATHRVFENIEGYYRNTPNSHLRGKIGEMACMLWLKNQKSECHAAFKDIGEMKCADIIIGSEPKVRLEVKTWNQKYWNEMGRCIAVGQFKSLQEKADMVIWCITPDKIEVDMRVNIVGWNTIEDISKAPQRMTGPPGKQVYNYQVAPEKIRSLGDLVSFYWH